MDIVFVRGVAKLMGKIGEWNVQNVTTKKSNTKLAKQLQGASDIGVMAASIPTHLIRRSAVTMRNYANKLCECMSMA